MLFDHMTLERFDHTADLIRSCFEGGALCRRERLQLGGEADEIETLVGGAECSFEVEDEIAHFAPRCAVSDTQRYGESRGAEVIGDGCMSPPLFAVEGTPDGKGEFVRFSPDVESFVSQHANTISCDGSGSIIKILQMYTFLRFDGSRLRWFEAATFQ